MFVIVLERALSRSIFYFLLDNLILCGLMKLEEKLCHIKYR